MNTKQMGAYLGALVTFASAFLPWASFHLPMGSIVVTGIEGNHGFLAMAIGLAGGILTFYRSRFIILAGVLALVLAGVEIIDMINSMESQELLESKGIGAAIGSGIYALVVGGITLVLSGWLLWREDRSP